MGLGLGSCPLGLLFYWLAWLLGLAVGLAVGMAADLTVGPTVGLAVGLAVGWAVQILCHLCILLRPNAQFPKKGDW